MSKHTYTVQTDYIGGLDGIGKIKALGFEGPFSVPKDLKGLGEGTNPEELLASAASTCYLITLGAILKFQGIAIESFHNRTEIEVESGDRLQVTALRHFPTIKVGKGTHSDLLKKIEAAVNQAEKFCIIGQALQSSISITVEATLEENA